MSKEIVKSFDRKEVSMDQVMDFISHNRVQIEKLDEFPIHLWQVEIAGDKDTPGSKLIFTSDEVNVGGFGNKIEFEVMETPYGNGINFRAICITKQENDIAEQVGGQVSLTDIEGVKFEDRYISYGIEVFHGNKMIQTDFPY